MVKHICLAEFSRKTYLACVSTFEHTFSVETIETLRNCETHHMYFDMHYTKRSENPITQNKHLIARPERNFVLINSLK